MVLVFRDQTEERTAQRAIVQGAARLQLLAESSREFSLATANISGLLDVIAHRISDLVGELCSIRLVSKDGEILEPGNALYHPDPEVLTVARQVLVPQRMGEGIAGKVAATGDAALVASISTPQLVARTPLKYQALVERLAVTSLLVVALKSRGRVLGVISMTRSDPANPYGEDDLVLAQDLADRAALAIENALLVSDLEQRVIERTAEIEAAHRELEAFSYSVAHDLRAPLRGISGFSSVLLEDYGDTLDAEGRGHLQRIVAGASRMAEIIDALLALARLTRTDLRRERLDMSELSRDAVAQLRANEPSREVDVVVKDGLTDQGDPVLVRALLENLLGNAWKFTSKRRDARIEFGCEERDDGVPVYVVRDNGAGFDMALAKKLFAPFQRLHTIAQFEGMGIGLATVQRIVRRPGGRIWAEGAENQGATFRFALS